MSWLRDLNDAPQVRQAVRQCGSVAAGGWGSTGGRLCGSEEGASIAVWGTGSRGRDARRLVYSKRRRQLGFGSWDFGALGCEEAARHAVLSPRLPGLSTGCVALS